jgi:hypothetical protein
MNDADFLNRGGEGLEKRLAQIVREVPAGSAPGRFPTQLSAPEVTRELQGVSAIVRLTDKGLPDVWAWLAAHLTRDSATERFTLEVSLKGGSIGSTGVALAATTQYRAKLVSASLVALASSNCPLWRAAGEALGEYLRQWGSMSPLAREVTRRRHATGAEPVGLGDIAQELAQLGYELDRGAIARYTGQNLTGAGAGESYPGCSYGIRDAQTKRSFAHCDGRRDAGFQALQKMRGTRFAIVRGAVLDL